MSGVSHFKIMVCILKIESALNLPFWYLSLMRAMKAQTRLCKCTVLLEPSLPVLRKEGQR